MTICTRIAQVDNTETVVFMQSSKTSLFQCTNIVFTELTRMLDTCIRCYCSKYELQIHNTAQQVTGPPPNDTLKPSTIIFSDLH